MPVAETPDSPSYAAPTVQLSASLDAWEWTNAHPFRGFRRDRTPSGRLSGPAPRRGGQSRGGVHHPGRDLGDSAARSEPSPPGRSANADPGVVIPGVVIEAPTDPAPPSTTGT